MPQIREQMVVPDLYVFTIKFHSNFSLYKKDKNMKIRIFQKNKYFFLPLFYATFQCGRYDIFKKKFKFFFDPEKVKKPASKVAHNWSRPFYFTVQPRPTAHSPELISHIMKSRDQTSVLLSVVF